MSVTISIKDNFEAIQDFYSDEVQRVVGPAVGAAINKTLIAARKDALKQIHKRIRINTRRKPKNTFKSQNVFLSKASGNNAYKMSGTMWFSKRPISMITFIIGKTDVIKQKGIKVKKRRKLKAEITRGKRFKVDKGFIQRGKKGNVQLFKRKAGQNKWKKQGTPSLTHIVGNSLLERSISKMMQLKFKDNLGRQIQWRLDKAAGKLKQSPQKKRK